MALTLARSCDPDVAYLGSLRAFLTALHPALLERDLWGFHTLRECFGIDAGSALYAPDGYGEARQAQILRDAQEIEPNRGRVERSTHRGRGRKGRPASIVRQRGQTLPDALLGGIGFDFAAVPEFYKTELKAFFAWRLSRPQSRHYLWYTRAVQLIPFCADLASTQAPAGRHLIDFGHPIESGSGRGSTPLRSLFEQWLAEREYSVRPMKRKWRRDATIHETAYGPVASAAANVLVFTLILLRERAKPVEARDLVLLEDVYPADEVPVTRSKAPYLSFFRIQLPWLRNVARRYVLNKIEHKELSPRTLPSYIASLGQIEACLYSLHSSPRPEHITQEFIEHTFLSWGNDKGFTGQNWYTDPLNMVQWASAYLPEYRWRRLVFDKRNVRRVRSYHPRTHEYERNLEDAMVPEEVIEQIFLRFDSLPVVCKRLLIIARYTGMRSIDLHALAFGCLAPDPDDADFMLLTFYQSKVKRWNTKPLHKNDAAHALVIQAIQDQQDDVRRAWRRETQYLFPHRLGDAEVHLSPGHTRDVIAKWIIRQGIRDKDGGIYKFGWHDLRHFYGTELALAGYDIMMIQMELGHASADMSLIYINQRLKLKKKAVLEKGGGKFISIKGEVDDKIAELALRKDASLAVDVPGGLCSLPGQIGEWCEHNGACFTCTYFRADIGQLPFFEKKMRTMAASLTRLKGEVEGFEHDGHRRMADIGRKRMERTQQGLANVKTIIKTIKAEGTFSGQARKYQRAAGSGAAAECDQAACGRRDLGHHAPER